MSDLQLALIVIGVLVVAAVYGFNWHQQRKFRRQSEQAFGEKPEDALFRRPAPAAAERIEPTLGGDSADAPPEPAKPVLSKGEGGVKGVPGNVAPDPEIEFLVEIKPRQPVRSEALALALQRRVDFDKPVRWLGLNARSSQWEEIQPGAVAQYSELIGALQLANRSGPVSVLKLSEFRDLAVELGGRLDAEVNTPDPDLAEGRAAKLDEFCAEVDVVMALNVVSRDGAAFPATKIRALAEASGFRLEPDGVFRYLDEEGVYRCSLCNQEDAPFLPEAVKSMATRGITFLLEIPRVAVADHAFDAMAAIARRFCSTLGAELVDDNRVPLNDAAVQRIKAQLQGICQKLDARGIPSGSERALRLFS